MKHSKVLISPSISALISMQRKRDNGKEQEQNRHEFQGVPQTPAYLRNPMAHYRKSHKSENTFILCYPAL